MELDIRPIEYKVVYYHLTEDDHKRCGFDFNKVDNYFRYSSDNNSYVLCSEWVQDEEFCDNESSLDEGDYFMNKPLQNLIIKFKKEVNKNIGGTQ